MMSLDTVWWPVLCLSFEKIAGELVWYCELLSAGRSIQKARLWPVGDITSCFCKVCSPTFHPVYCLNSSGLYVLNKRAQLVTGTLCASKFSRLILFVLWQCYDSVIYWLECNQNVHSLRFDALSLKFRDRFTREIGKMMLKTHSWVLLMRLITLLQQAVIYNSKWIV